MNELSIVRDETGAVLGSLNIRTSLMSIRVPFPLPGDGEVCWGELLLHVRRWRCADGKIEPYLFCPAEHVPCLEKVKGFVKAPAAVSSGTAAGI